MKINKVTITGADSETHIDALVKLYQEYPFVEFGILFSASKAGELRYPDLDLRDKFGTLPINLSAHFCGVWAREVIEHSNFTLINHLTESFKRVQINYSFRDYDDFNFTNLIDFAKTSSKSIILQYNKGNSKILNTLIHNDIPPNIHFLYDASGGNGIEIENINPPLGKQYTGYAGGLSPENIQRIAVDVISVPDNSYVWLDLEGGARTGNHFDLSKVNSILKQSKPFIRS